MKLKTQKSLLIASLILGSTYVFADRVSTTSTSNTSITSSNYTTYNGNAFSTSTSTTNLDATLTEALDLTFSIDDENDTTATFYSGTKWSVNLYGYATVIGNDYAEDDKNAIYLSISSSNLNVQSTGTLNVDGNTYANGNFTVSGIFNSTGDVYVAKTTTISGTVDMDGALTLGSAGTLTIDADAKVDIGEGIVISSNSSNSMTVLSSNALSGDTIKMSEDSSLSISFTDTTQTTTSIGSIELSDGSDLTIELIDSKVAIIESISVAEGATSSIILSNYDDGLLQIVDPDGLYSFTLDGDSTYLVIGDDKIEITADGYEGDLVSSLTNSLVSTVVPEPSTYAMIFGAIALGLAAYRRRK